MLTSKLRPVFYIISLIITVIRPTLARFRIGNHRNSQRNSPQIAQAGKSRMKIAIELAWKWAITVTDTDAWNGALQIGR